MEDVLSLASRRTVFERVTEHPGAHLRDLARRAGLPLGTALHHLGALEAHGLIASRRDGRYRRYFAVASDVGRREREVLSALRHETPRRIVEALLSTDGLTQRELCARLRVSRSTLSLHVNALVQVLVVGRVETRPEGTYALCDRELVASLFERYGASLSSSPVPTAHRQSPAAPSGVLA